jgi:AraC-like DNA-binding protein
MPYRRYTPEPPLAAFVDSLWYSEGFEGSHKQERLLPNGESGIIFDLREGPVRIYEAESPCNFNSFEPAVFCGARTDCFIIDTCAQERVIGIQFRPGGALPFLNVPACEVAHATYALDDVWPGDAALLREEMLCAGRAGNVNAMFVILERTLRERMEKHWTLHPAVSFAANKLAQPSANTRVGDVADQVGFSSRHFTDLFRAQIGLTPKAFHRVRRFQQVLQKLRQPKAANRYENWATLALDCGYYDQAHFIHDFSAFAGMTPGEYVAIATQHLNHVPLR